MNYTELKRKMERKEERQTILKILKTKSFKNMTHGINEYKVCESKICMTYYSYLSRKHVQEVIFLRKLFLAHVFVGFESAKDEQLMSGSFADLIENMHNTRIKRMEI
ncbi:MAG: hypothetical protein MR332_07835 [Fusicatenibacter sp.]|nr:hypothetical protein [Fusicatenibacter sp.]